MGKTHLFYSPVLERFVYKEMVGEAHQFVFRDQDGKDYSREEFETLIPFIYYKNMELWGKLPLEIDGQSFDKAAIRAERQVFELKPPELRGHAPRIQLFPLLESNPGRARLRFPENVFRAGERQEFIDSDRNRLDPELTERFAGALNEAGFQFPARLVAGRVSILKPFEAGYLLVDHGGTVFHLKRLDGEPVVVKTPIPTDLGIRFWSGCGGSLTKKRGLPGLSLFPRARKARLFCKGPAHGGGGRFRFFC